MVDALATEGDEDVIACDKLRGAGKYASIRRFPNGKPTASAVPLTEYIGQKERTR